ncbi:MAG: hypothetical protein JNK95_13690 [Candidatus Competibacter sp.]|nr:hypothetical protein [Candidatus Competibacter sp.]MDG4606732.1 hypothetical protein [Candidatus Contendobacter sp.]HRD48240.1 hypothetical protein [Candidatus Contendobacter sp.]
MSGISRAGVVILTAALTPGCTLYQTLMEKITQPATPPQATPATTQSALEPKLDAMSVRLGRMEQALAEVREQGRQRQRSETQTRQALSDLRQGVWNTQVAVTDVQKQMRQVTTQQAALKVQLERTVTGSSDFWAVDVPLGELPNGGGQRETRRIPTLVPDKAREILVYAQIATGYVKGGTHRFRISVRVEGEREAAFYLYAFGQPQPGWSYNSDNVWLPMPKNRELILQTEGEPFFGDWSSEVRIIAYR